MRKSVNAHNIILAILIVMTTFCMTACYSIGELNSMSKYEKQGKKNAISYIEGKYGFTPDVLEVKSATRGNLDITPAPTGEVYVVMEYEGRKFVVFISGEEKSSEGIDNYQFSEVKAYLEAELERMTGLDITEIFLSYGESYFEDHIGQNGMVNTYFDGINLKDFVEVAYQEGKDFDVIVSSVNQDIEGIDAEAVKSATGIENFLFVDYDNYEHYKRIEKPYYNITGSPIENGVDKNLVYINSYRIINPVKDEYYNGENQAIDDIVFITDTPDNTITIEEATIDIENFNNREQVFGAYSIGSDTDYMYIFVPVEHLYTTNVENAQIVCQYVRDGEAIYNKLLCKLTDDGKYLGAKIINFNEITEVKFSVMMYE